MGRLSGLPYAPRAATGAPQGRGSRVDYDPLAPLDSKAGIPAAYVGTEFSLPFLAQAQSQSPLGPA